MDPRMIRIFRLRGLGYNQREIADKIGGISQQQISYFLKQMKAKSSKIGEEAYIRSLLPYLASPIEEGMGDIPWHGQEASYSLSLNHAEKFRKIDRNMHFYNLTVNQAEKIRKIDRNMQKVEQLMKDNEEKRMEQEQELAEKIFTRVNDLNIEHTEKHFSYLNKKYELFFNTEEENSE
jgi:hypothetical protein